MKDNLIKDKSYAFALATIKLYQSLTERKEFCSIETIASLRN